MMFRSHRNTSKFSLSDYVTMAMVIFSISSHVKDKNSVFTARDEDMFFEVFSFCKKRYLLVGASGMLWTGGSVRDVCMSHQSDWIYY